MSTESREQYEKWCADLVRSLEETPVLAERIRAACADYLAEKDGAARKLAEGIIIWVEQERRDRPQRERDDADAHEREEMRRYDARWPLGGPPIAPGTAPLNSQRGLFWLETNAAVRDGTSFVSSGMERLLVRQALGAYQAATTPDDREQMRGWLITLYNQATSPSVCASHKHLYDQIASAIEEVIIA